MTGIMTATSRGSSPKAYILLSYYTCIIPALFYITYSTHCNTASSCSDKDLTCSGSSCPLNCNADDSCAGSTIICTDDYLHGTCIINCTGQTSCNSTHVVSYRDLTINCVGEDSCDDLTVEVYGDNPNDKISATLTSQGSNTDTVRMACHNDGISTCTINCVDNGEFYTCVGVILDCYTTGTCVYHCDSSDACCGCSLSSTAYVNELNCYEGTGNNNCIQEDPGGCSESYGCIAIQTFPTPLPTTSPSKSPTKFPSSDPSKQPSKSPTKLPSSNPSKQPTSSPTTYMPSMSPITSPTRNPNSAVYCIPLLLTITDLIGVDTNDFMVDTKLQQFVVSNTKSIIYNIMSDSFVYDIHTLCNDFWQCFYLELRGITGDTKIALNVCSYAMDVNDALYNKISSDRHEMAAYMISQLEFYLNGPEYNGYDNVNLDNLSVSFVIQTTTTTTAVPTGDGLVNDVTNTDSIHSTDQQAINNDQSSGNTTTIIVIMTVLIVVIIGGFVAFFVYKRSKHVHKNKANQLQRHAIELSSNPEDDIVMVTPTVGAVITNDDDIVANIMINVMHAEAEMLDEIDLVVEGSQNVMKSTENDVVSMINTIKDVEKTDIGGMTASCDVNDNTSAEHIGNVNSDAILSAVNIQARQAVEIMLMDRNEEGKEDKGFDIDEIFVDDKSESNDNNNQTNKTTRDESTTTGGANDVTGGDNDVDNQNEK